MTKCNPGQCEVGILWDYADTDTIWEADLKREGSDVLTEIRKFDFCPTCGHKIEWQRIEKELEDYFKKLEVSNAKKRNI